MYSDTIRQRALALRDDGDSCSAVSRALGVSRAAIRDWEVRRAEGTLRRAKGCPRCDDQTIDPPGYAALLGYYLGDGCISRARRCYFLRVTCDERYGSIVDDVEEQIRRVRPGARVFRVRGDGCVNVTSNWVHWPCLFPQHGPGRKHERPIVLEEWQRSLVESERAAFLRGLFHSDGCRARNWTRRIVAGEWKRYDYPRWQFTNNSADIRELCCWALDLAGVAWRQSNWKTISVSRRADVARLDQLIGMKE